jgi:hypothetical protein
MSSNGFFKDLAFSDPVRHLQRTSDNTTTSSGSDRYFVGIYIVGLAMIVMVAIWCVKTIRSCVCLRRVNAIDAPELPPDKSVHKLTKSTLAKRKQAILELFKTSQVTMVSRKTEIARHQNYQCSQRRKLTTS